MPKKVIKRVPLSAKIDANVLKQFTEYCERERRVRSREVEKAIIDLMAKSSAPQPPIVQRVEPKLPPPAKPAAQLQPRPAPQVSVQFKEPPDMKPLRPRLDILGNPIPGAFYDDEDDGEDEACDDEMFDVKD